jgi:SsrA-binding protein
MSSENRKVVARNRKATFDYHLLETFEAGIALAGVEIKSIRANQINLQDGWVQERGGDLWLMGVHITPYQQADRFHTLDPRRPRQLLLHKKEIARIASRANERGLTIVPTMVYLKNGRAKVEIALAKGKQQHDKRQDIAKRDSDLEIRRALRDQRDD